ncbi:deoxyguanosinetriphosphate triphosphohydrolase-like protein [Alphaproteobacteria bacterium]|nr:deoxyguanosinetriphosphate triphosphohydrolase-like protein [Alphaproteobacteria bacterium]
MKTASFASRPEQSLGRLFPQAESATRSAFQRDRDRIIHSEAFRKMKYKTQVFVYHEGDNYRTRLTHSLEVAQIARAAARYLGLDEDLAEALGLAHDLGHTPFGHAGEDALDELTSDIGGFDHNAQSLRVVTRLEQRYWGFDGLNLTWETLEGLIKHNGPLTGPHAKGGSVSRAILAYNERHDLMLSTFASAEAQLAAVADDIAYNNHDIDDGLRAGLFRIEDLADVPLVGPVFRAVKAEYPDIDVNIHIHESVRRLIGLMVSDLLSETARRIEEMRPRSVDDVRNAERPLVGFSDEMRENDRNLKKFLFENMYRHTQVNRMASKARRAVRDLYDLLCREPECLPPPWRKQCEGRSDRALRRVVADYIASM